MATKVIIMVQDTDEYSQAIADRYLFGKGTLDWFVDSVRKDYPQAVCAEPIEESIQGEIVEENDRYVLTNESHNMGETMRVYGKE